MRVQPDERDAAVPRGKTLHGADVGAAAAAEDERPVGQVGGHGEGLLHQRVGLDDARLGVRQGQMRRLRHRLALVSPGPRNAHEPGAERPAA